MNYQGKELKFIKDYGKWILFEDEFGIKQGINKHDLGLLKEMIKPPKSNIKPENVTFL